MKINYIKLVDCIGIHKGLGLSEIEIDLSVFKSGLIGVFGKSGSGKSTLLRNLSPYRTDFKNDFYEQDYVIGQSFSNFIYCVIKLLIE